MKKTLFTSIAAALVLSANAQSYTPVNLTGLDADIIANGSGSATSSTTHNLDGIMALVAQNFVSPTGQSPSQTGSLPNNGLITSAITTTPGLTFQLAPYTGNNALRITGNSSGTVTFAAPVSTSDLYVLLTPIAFTGTITTNITVNFTDGTNQVFSNIVLNNWYGSTNSAYNGTTRVNRSTNALDVQTMGPKMHQQKLTLSATNASKSIQNIVLTNNSAASTSDVLHVMAVTTVNTFANDAGITAITGLSTGCGLTSQETITISVRNFGTAAQSNIPVSYQINGGTAVTGTIAGPVAPGATATYTFTTKANLSAAGTYSIMAKTALATDANTINDGTTISVINSMLPALPITLDFETATSGLGVISKTINTRSSVFESTGATNGAGTKGLIMDGVNNAGWIIPAGATNPWTSNPTNLASVKFCINPAGGNATDPLWLSFDLKQLYKTSNANTNFRVKINGTPVGGNQGTAPANTYRPPFSGSPIAWQRINIDLTSYKSQPGIEITLESSVKEEYANGTGTANLIDNIQVLRSAPTGVKETVLESLVLVSPNPSNGIFQISAPVQNYSLEVTDLTGKVMQHEIIKSKSAQVDLSQAAKGVYLLRIVSDNQIATRKLIVE
jgi:hypothetical protein